MKASGTRPTDKQVVAKP